MRRMFHAAKVATAVTAVVMLVIVICGAAISLLARVLESTGLTGGGAFLVAVFVAGWILIFALEWREGFS